MARVRLDDLAGGGGSSNGAAAAVQRSAEALQEYMALEQSGNFNAVTVSNLRCVCCVACAGQLDAGTVRPAPSQRWLTLLPTHTAPPAAG
jgi:hypothetical protein